MAAIVAGEVFAAAATVATANVIMAGTWHHLDQQCSIKESAS